MINYTGTYTDQYQLTMAQVYYFKGQKNNTAVFDYFFRKLPFGGGYAIFAGLEDLLSLLTHLRFDDADLQFLEEKGFHSEFLDYLKNFKFRGNVYASREGDVVFPTRPVVIIEANIIEAQIVETMVLNILNFQTLIATKAARCRQAAEDRELIDFGLRRAQSVGAYHASRAAVIGGFNGTSNVRAGRDYHIPLSGTMSHSFIQSYDKEIDAFRDFANVWPENCVLLVDTYDTLKSGVPNAIKIAKEMESRGEMLKGIRLDSGDLVLLAKKTRQMLDEAGLGYVKIAVSNQLNEYLIKDLINKNAPIDWFGVGTNLVIGQPDAALNGVYKLAFSNGEPRIKISESKDKITIPCKKQVYRVLNEKNEFSGMDVIALHENDKEFGQVYNPFKKEQCWRLENCQIEPLLHLVIRDGQRLTKPENLQTIAAFSKQRFSQLPDEFKQFDAPKAYNISLSRKLKCIWDNLIQLHKK